MQSLKTTLVVFGVEDGKAWLAHIGDSRGYIFYKGKIKYRSLDHSVPQMLALSGEIQEREIRNHPDRNHLLRCLGDDSTEPNFEISDSFEIKKGMSVLLCSDGFWESITEKEMAQTLRWSRTASQWLEKMKQKLKRKSMREKGKDNYSAIAIWF